MINVTLRPRGVPGASGAPPPASAARHRRAAAGRGRGAQRRRHAAAERGRDARPPVGAAAAGEAAAHVPLTGERMDHPRSGRCRAPRPRLPKPGRTNPWGESVAKVGKKVFVFFGDEAEGRGVHGSSASHEEASACLDRRPGYGLGRRLVTVARPRTPDRPRLDQDRSYRLVASSGLGRRGTDPGLRASNSRRCAASIREPPTGGRSMRRPWLARGGHRRAAHHRRPRRRSSARTGPSTCSARRPSPATTTAWSTTSRPSSSPAAAARSARSRPLPDIPTKVERGGDWTLQRLILETDPPASRPFFAAERGAGRQPRGRGPARDDDRRARHHDPARRRRRGRAVGQEPRLPPPAGCARGPRLLRRAQPDLHGRRASTPTRPRSAARRSATARRSTSRSRPTTRGCRCGSSRSASRRPRRSRPTSTCSPMRSPALLRTPVPSPSRPA